MRQVSSNYSLLLPCHLFACHAFHIMSSCTSHLHTCSSHASEYFPRCPFRNPALLWPLAFPFCLLLSVGVKLSQNRPRFAKRPWYTTDGPPVKFRAIWSPFDTPTVNRGTVKASCVLQPNTPPKWPNPITIAWPKTAPHLDSPSSLYAYIYTPPFSDLFFFPPKP